MKWEKQAVTYVDSWRPFALLGGALLGGLIIGLVITLYSCSPSGVLRGSREDSYLVLAATLYGEGESLEAMKVYLNSYAPRDPASAMLQLADRYEKSSDRKKQQQAKDLRQLGEALKLGREPAASRPTVASNIAPGVSPTTTTATQLSVPSPAAGAPAASSVVTPPPPTPTTGPGPTSPALSGRAVARPSGSGGAIMRQQPNTKSAWVGSLPNGTKVEIIRVVQGEAVDPAESRWYEVKFENKTGYVYFKLIGPAE